MSAAVILAGGKSRRMGRDKLELTVGGKTLLESDLQRFSEVFDDVYLSVGDAQKYPGIHMRRIVDIYPGAGPMSGLHAALSTLECDGIFLVAADLPFACPHAAKRIIELCGESDACIIKLPDGKLEPLFGYYRKTLLPLSEEALKSGENRMDKLLLRARTRFIDPSELGELWDEEIMLNINCPEDYEKLQKHTLRT